MTSNAKYIELVDKENTKVGPPQPKKDKLSEEPVKKTVLGESCQPKILVNEPSSP